MDAFAELATAKELARNESPIMGARYISAVALSCLLYDHLLHFNDEVTDIWLNFGRRTTLKSLFLLGRYCAIMAVMYTAIGLGSFNTKMETQGYAHSANQLPNLDHCGGHCLAILIDWNRRCVEISSGEQARFLRRKGRPGIVIYRLRSLWHFNRPITRAITAMVVAVFISAAVCVSIQTVNLRDLFRPAPLGLPGCLFNSPSPKPFAYMLVLGLAFVIWDIFNICIFTVNTFATPYLYSSDILKRFQRDGGRYFIYLLVVHSLYLFTNAFGGNSRLSTIPLATALTTIINARIFHGIASEAEKHADEYDIILPKVTNR